MFCLCIAHETFATANTQTLAVARSFDVLLIASAAHSRHTHTRTHTHAFGFV
jgi:hypothetical protein